VFARASKLLAAPPAPDSDDAIPHTRVFIIIIIIIIIIIYVPGQQQSGQ
jgi:hypothetical protein